MQNEEEEEEEKITFEKHMQISPMYQGYKNASKA